jgi:transposase
MPNDRTSRRRLSVGGSKRLVDVREVVNAIMYVLGRGCQWRYVPKDLPPSKCAVRLFQLIDLGRHAGAHLSYARREVSRSHGPQRRAR